MILLSEYDFDNHDSSYNLTEDKRSCNPILEL